MIFYRQQEKQRSRERREGFNVPLGFDQMRKRQSSGRELTTRSERQQNKKLKRLPSRSTSTSFCSVAVTKKFQGKRRRLYVLDFFKFQAQLAEWFVLFYELSEYENGPVKFDSFCSWVGFESTRSWHSRPLWQLTRLN